MKTFPSVPKLKQVFVVPNNGKLIVILKILVTILYKAIPKHQVLNHGTRQVTETGVSGGIKMSHTAQQIERFLLKLNT